MYYEQRDYPRNGEDYGGGGSRSTRERANAGLTLGIIGTVLGAAALWGRGGGIGNILGGGGGSMPANVNINGGFGHSGHVAPTAFEAYQHECEDVIALTNTLWSQKVDTMKGFYDYRNVDVAEKFGLYKDNRDNIDGLNNRINNELFSLYKYTRDKDDETNARLSRLEKEVAVNTAVRPYQDKLIQCEIDKAFTAGINYVDRKTCKMLEGIVTLPLEPTVTGAISQTCCNRFLQATTGGA